MTISMVNKLIDTDSRYSGNRGNAHIIDWIVNDTLECVWFENTSFVLFTNAQANSVMCRESYKKKCPPVATDGMGV
jgi:hypothetical protein